MRTPIAHVALFGLFGLLTATAEAIPSDIKVLAKFDIGFARCEALYPHMRGHRDEAYLSLWKVKADEKARAELAKVRKGEAYRRERQLALKSLDKGDGQEAQAKLKGQCQATWTETQRNTPLVKP